MVTTLMVVGVFGVVILALLLMTPTKAGKTGD